MNKKHLVIIRKPAVLKRLSISKSTLQNWINEGKFPKPIPLGARAVGFIEADVDQVLETLISGASEDSVKYLVRKINMQRGK